MYSDVITTLPFTVCAVDPKLQRLRPRTTYDLRTTTTTTADFGVGRHVVGKAVYGKIRAVSITIVLFSFSTGYRSRLQYRLHTTYYLVIECCSGYQDIAGGLNCERKRLI